MNKLWSLLKIDPGVTFAAAVLALVTIFLAISLYISS